MAKAKSASTPKKPAAKKAAAKKPAFKMAARRKVAIHIRRKATASEIRSAFGITETVRQIAAAAVDEAGIE
jgi:hypothetical protein